MSSGKDMADQYGYSDAVRSGDLVFCSGQVGLDEDGKPPLDPEQQFRRAFAAVARVLAEAGCQPADVVDLTSFHTRYPENMTAFMAAKAAFQQGSKPAWTAVGVAALGMPDTLVELKAIARIPARTDAAGACGTTGYAR